MTGPVAIDSGEEGEGGAERGVEGEERGEESQWRECVSAHSNLERLPKVMRMK